jgi:hypothetical protein
MIGCLSQAGGYVPRRDQKMSKQGWMGERVSDDV